MAAHLRCYTHLCQQKMGQGKQRWQTLQVDPIPTGGFKSDCNNMSSFSYQSKTEHHVGQEIQFILKICIYVFLSF